MKRNGWLKYGQLEKVAGYNELQVLHGKKNYSKKVGNVVFHGWKRYEEAEEEE